MGVKIAVEDRMANIVDIEHMFHKDFATLDSNIVIVAEPKAANMDSDCSEKISVV